MYYSPEQPRRSPVDHADYEGERNQDLYHAYDDLSEQVAPGWSSVGILIVTLLPGWLVGGMPPHRLRNPNIWVKAA